MVQKDRVMTKILFLFSIFFLVTLFVPLVVFAQEINQNELVVLKQDQTIDQDYFAAGETVRISGTVDGDAYIVGGNVFVDGTINGDLLTAGGTVMIRGTVTDDVRVAGGTVTISGDVGKNITVTAGNALITENATVGGSVVAGVGTLEIFAPLGRGLTIGAGQATIGSEINGDVLAGVGTITLANNAKINGNLTYYAKAQTQLTQAESASVSGIITHNISVHDESMTREKAAGAFAGIGFFLKVLSLLSALILGLLLLQFVPDFTKRTAGQINDRFFLALFVGFMTFLLAPVVILVLFVTLVGIPFAVLLALMIAALLFFAKVFAALFIGQRVLLFLNQKTSLGWTYFIGLVLYGFITAIPIFGWIISILALFTGTGALLIEKKELYTSLHSKKIL